MKQVSEDVSAFAKEVHNNPEKFAEERKALNLSEDATEEEAKKAIGDDLMNALESNRQESLSKAQVYNNLGKQVSENGEGRFLLSGENTEEQANAIMKEVKKD